MENMDKKTAELLLKIGAIKMNSKAPFVWASGWYSPIYCDNRLSLSYPKVRNYVKEKIVTSINKNFPNVETIAGVATAGIPQATLVADKMNLPLLYVRPKPKEHGLENLIEGKVFTGHKVVVIEDLVSTGGSSIKAALGLREAGLEVLGLITIFTYGFAVAKNNFQKANIKFLPLTDYTTLLEVALEKGEIDANEVLFLNEWRERPESWRNEDNKA